MVGKGLVDSITEERLQKLPHKYHTSLDKTYNFLPYHVLENMIDICGIYKKYVEVTFN